jgi:hypothetical protein
MDVPDLRPWLDAWPYRPEAAVRILRTEDGREIIQVRRPLGIDQFEADGRPDGVRPQGAESWLEHYLERQRAWESKAGRDREFHLSHKDCERLHEEGVLYYYRYVLFFQLEDFARVVRDTERNLRMFDLVHDCADIEEDRVMLDQYRPYILRMNAIAKAMVFSKAGDIGAAIEAVENGMTKIRNLTQVASETFDMERDRSLDILKGTADELRRNKPLTAMERLERDLAEAIAAERYEDAARIRDEIQEKRGPGTDRPGDSSPPAKP